MLRERYLRGARPGHEGLDRAGHLRLQRPLQPAALRQHLAAAGAEAASADLDPGRRLGRDLAVVRRDGLRLLLPVAISATRPARRRWTASGTRWRGSARTAIPYRAGFLQFVGVAETPRAGAASSTASRPSISTAAACTSIRASRRRPATSPRRRSAPASQGRSAAAASLASPRRKARSRPRSMEDIVDERLRHHRLARRGGRAAARGRDQPQCRPPDAAAAVRQHEQGPDQVQHEAVRREGDAAS